jgi:hypothetical protein
MKNLDKNITNQNNFIVYIHIRPDTNEPFYVGMGSIGRDLQLAGRNNFWKNIVNKNKGKFESKILFEGLSKEEALIKEREVELYLKDQGFKLTNIIECGIKGRPTGLSHSEKTIQKMSDFWKNYYSKNPSPKKGIKMSKESSEKKSKSMMGKKVRLGVKDSEEVKKKKSEAFKKRNIDWTYRNQMVSQKRRKPILQYDLKDNFIREWNSAQEFEDTTGLKSNGGICLCCQGKIKQALGYK